MDFFDRQTQAQRKTKLLVFYFIMAVVGIIATLQVVFALILRESPLDLQLLGIVSLGVVVVVTIGSLIKILELSQGGRVVAAMLGGRQVSVTTTDLNEKKLLNVVEEMAIASGVPVPEIYLLPDDTINAFAAGHGPGDTAIGVTRGCIDQLSRDELQGVIAHEFSHILHGDMKLNLRLIGLLNGILGLALVGSIIMRSSLYVRSGGGNDRDRNSGNGQAALVLGGLALYLVGWIGVFFGNLIKAAVSRQREFLADASAVQYTRNPLGIAGALWKISRADSRISSPRAEEASHMYFGNGLSEHWFQAFATHPPLAERIQAIAPNFTPPSDSATPPPIPDSAPETSNAPSARQESPFGALTPLLSALPAFADDTVRDLHGACAFIYAVLLDERDEYREAQLAALQVDAALRREMLGLFARRAEIPMAQRLALVDLTIPTLRHLSPAQYADFRRNVRQLIESDQAIHLFEFALQKTVIRHLDLYFSNSTGPKVRYHTMEPVAGDIAELLSGLAYVGYADEAARDAAFAAGAEVIPSKLTRNRACDLGRIDAALDRLAEAAPLIKRAVLEAGRRVVAQDAITHPEEYELLRAIADTLDCPMPALPASA